MSFIKRFVHLFYPPIMVFTFHLICDQIFHMYQRFPVFDIPMHILGGIAMGLTGYLMLCYAQKELNVVIPQRIVQWILITFWVVFTTVIWEFAEFLGDYFFGTHMQMGLADTMGDMFMGLMGGVVVGAVCIYKKKK